MQTHPEMESKEMELMNTAKILVTYAGVYDMPAEPGRDAMKGCTVQYFFLGEHGEEFSTRAEWDVSRPVGFQRAKVSLDYAKRAKIGFAPAIYEGRFVMTLGGDGKPVAKLVDLDFVAEFDFDLDSILSAKAADSSNAASASAPAAAPGKNAK